MGVGGHYTKAEAEQILLHLMRPNQAEQSYHVVLSSVEVKCSYMCMISLNSYQLIQKQSLDQYINIDQKQHTDHNNNFKHASKVILCMNSP